MNEDFEQHLTRTPRRTPPPEWRADILRAANEAAGLPQRELRPRTATPTRLGWWEHLWLRFPLPTTGLAAAWIFAALLSASERRMFETPPHGSQAVSSEQIAVARAERKALWEGFVLADGRPEEEPESSPQHPSPPPRVHPRPRSDRSHPDDDRFGLNFGRSPSASA